MYAIIEDKGRQFKVTSGDTILLDRPGESTEGEGTSGASTTDAKKTLTFDRVLLVGGDGALKIGARQPLRGATVTAEIVGEAKGKKVHTVRYHRRKGFHKKIGHRQKYLSVKITGITV